MTEYLITGGTGLIGSALIARLVNANHLVTVLTRNSKSAATALPREVQLVENLVQIPQQKHFDYVVNLAGEPIADSRWSKKQKKKLWASRVTLTHDLVHWIKQRPLLPKALISGSAIGWYGDGKDKVLNEQSAANPEYTHSLCQAWEAEALQLSDTSVRVCIIRTGLVIHPSGGFLQKLLPAFKLGLGARLGCGTQYMSWIHIDDMVSALLFLIDDNKPQITADPPLRGIFNLSSPTPVTNTEFTKTLAAQLQRPNFLVVPNFVLKLMLGEMSRLLITGQRLEPQRLCKAGFNFHYPRLKEALSNALN